MSDINKDKEILSVIQNPLGLEPRPFDYYAGKLGISVEQTIQLIKDCIDRGIIRRFSGIVKHNRVGYLFNAMVAFQVDDDKCDAAGEMLSGFSFITHCYRRSSYPDWPYNLYAMMHARDEAEFNERIDKMKNGFSYISMAVLPTKKEFKKGLYLMPDGNQLTNTNREL